MKKRSVAKQSTNFQSPNSFSGSGGRTQEGREMDLPSLTPYLLQISLFNLAYVVTDRVVIKEVLEAHKQTDPLSLIVPFAIIDPYLTSIKLHHHLTKARVIPQYKLLPSLSYQPPHDPNDSPM